MESKFTGTGVALVTPFHDDMHIDFQGLENVINHTIDNGVHFLVSLGTTGESVTLTKDEKKQVLKFTVEKAAGRVPIVAGFGGNNTQDIVDSIGNADFSGIDAILSVSPYYNKPTQKGIFKHYKAIADASPIPVILYNVPSRTSSNINAETTIKLSQVKNIIGIKEASGDFQQIMTIVKNKPEDFFIVSGDDALTLPMIGVGCEGVISVIANAFPKEFTNMVRTALDGDFTGAGVFHYKLFETMSLMFKEGNPAGVKCACQLLNLCGPTVRLPLVQASNELESELKIVIKQFLPLASV